MGGGIGGLVAARRLVLGGRTVILLEASDRLGGSVQRHVVGGIDLDAGAESFATRGGTVAKLATSLGLGEAIVEPNPQGAWLHQRNGTSLPLPKASMLGIPGSPLAADVIAILGGRAAFRAFLEALLPGTYGDKSKTLGELVRRRMGKDVVEKLVAPIVRGVHSTDPDHLELDRVAPGLRAGMRRTGSLARAVLDMRSNAAAGSAVAGIRGGINRLVEELEADLARFGVDVRLGARVTEVLPGVDATEGSDAQPGSVVVNGERLHGTIVVAAPGLLGDDPAAGHLTVLATLVVDEPRLDAAPRGTGVLVAEGAPGIRSRALTHATAKWPWLAERTGGKHVLRLSYPEPHENLAEVARADASALLGIDLSASKVVDFARVDWVRPNRTLHSSEGILRVGETIAGTGLANIVAQAEAQAAALLAGAER